MIEILSLRDDCTKHFFTGYDDEGKEKCVAQNYPIPIHYKKDGEWLDIKPEWNNGVLSGVPYEAELNGVGCDEMRLLDVDCEPKVVGHRVFFRNVFKRTDAILIASAMGVQLHLIIYGIEAPKEFKFYYKDPTPIGGRDNIEQLVKRKGLEQNYEVEITHDVKDNIVTKIWTGRVKAMDTSRRKYWGDAAYPVRII